MYNVIAYCHRNCNDFQISVFEVYFGNCMVAGDTGKLFFVGVRPLGSFCGFITVILHSEVKQ